MLPYSEKFYEILNKSIDFVKKMNRQYVTTEDLLYNILIDENDLSYKLKEVGLDAIKVYNYILDKKEFENKQNDFSISVVVYQNLMIANDLSEKYIDEEYFILASLINDNCNLKMLFVKYEIDLLYIFDYLMDKSKINIDKIRDLLEKDVKNKRPRKLKYLNKYAKNLTKLAKENKIDKIIGRENEISRIEEILSRKRKNNPCLVGEPGVGKTAIVEGLAIKTVNAKEGEFLYNKEIFSLDIAKILAGTRLRGDFEERFIKIVNEAKNENVILFIDEIHTIIGSGAADGSVDGASILKPALARGELKLIGATTFTEYKKYFEKDQSLVRRFQKIDISEPTRDEAVYILENIKDIYEDFHNVSIDKSLLENLVDLSIRYIYDKKLPDKAIDILDETMSRVKVSNRVENKVTEFDFRNALKNNDFDKAREFILSNDVKKDKIEISITDIMETISKMTKIPLKNISEQDIVMLGKLESVLKSSVIGQDEAISLVTKAIKRSQLGINNPNKPLGTFLFLGPTGVGKTELTKVLSKTVYKTDDAFIRIDMSEFKERHDTSKLIGAPPGYVGYGDDNALSDKVYRNPYSLILFDEIEKANKETLDLLLQILDDGVLTDSNGRKISFKNTIIVMTSNIGANMIVEPKLLGFNSVVSEKQEYLKMKDDVMQELKATFRPEFINRIDDVIVFNMLNESDIEQISKLLLDEVSIRIKDKLKINLKYTNAAVKKISQMGYDKKYGARPLRRCIQKNVEDIICDKFINREVKEEDELVISVKNGELSYIVK